MCVCVCVQICNAFVRSGSVPSNVFSRTTYFIHDFTAILRWDSKSKYYHSKDLSQPADVVKQRRLVSFPKKALWWRFYRVTIWMLNWRVRFMLDTSQLLKWTHKKRSIIRFTNCVKSKLPVHKFCWLCSNARTSIDDWPYILCSDELLLISIKCEHCTATQSCMKLR